MSELITFREEGIFCEQAGIFIDPWKPVSKAVITHAHADHSRAGMGAYLSHHWSIPVMKHRLGEQIKTQGLEYGENLNINGVQISLHPAGHIPGSAQVRLEYKGEIWCVSGDYKLQNDGVSHPWEAVKCTHFITESTFGLPVFKWPEQEEVMAEILQWWRENTANGLNSVLFVYSLGKAQRILASLPELPNEVLVHGAIHNTNEVLADFIDLPKTTYLSNEIDKSRLKGSLILAPPSAFGSPWMKKLKPYSTAMASGWMAMRGTRRRRNTDRGFILSDHADWEGLNKAVMASEAERVYVTHGYSNLFSRWLIEQGVDAEVVVTNYTEQEVDTEES
jgi:putative mRNA 3-end processing factor